MRRPRFLSDRLYNGSPYAIGPLSVLSVLLVYCGQTAGWTSMPLGTEVGVGTGDIVLDGEPAPPRKEAQKPLVSARVYCAQTVAHLSNY